MMKKYKPYIIQIAAALLTGGLSALLTRGSFYVYEEAAKPPLAPPSFIFPIVWSILFILMGIGAALVYKTEKRIPFIYWLQLFVNFIWPLLFFNMQAFLFAFIWLVLLWVLILIMLSEFYKINKKAAYLQIPYFIWVTFAGYLNLMVWILSRY